MENKLYIPKFDNMSDISKNKHEFVLQDWVGKLNFKQQTGLISAVRGYDGNEGYSFGCGLKAITKMVRGIVLKNADTSTSFMSLKPLDRNDVVDTLCKWTENQEEWHWLNHIVMAMHTISLYHNNEYVKLYFREICTSYASQVKVINERLDNIESSLNKNGNYIGKSDISIPFDIPFDEKINVVEKCFEYYDSNSDLLLDNNINLTTTITTDCDLYPYVGKGTWLNIGKDVYDIAFAEGKLFFTIQDVCEYVKEAYNEMNSVVNDGNINKRIVNVLNTITNLNSKIALYKVEQPKLLDATLCNRYFVNENVEFLNKVNTDLLNGKVDILKLTNFKLEFMSYDTYCSCIEFVSFLEKKYINN